MHTTPTDKCPFLQSSFIPLRIEAGNWRNSFWNCPVQRTTRIITTRYYTKRNFAPPKGSTSTTNAFTLYHLFDLSRLQNLLRLATLRKRLIKATTLHWRRLRRISTRCSTTQSSTTRKARMSISMPRNCSSSSGNRLARTVEEGSQRESAQESTRTSFRRSSIMARSIKSVRFVFAHPC